MRICIVYDCLYPHTVGGAERWYRNLAERLAAEGHEVTYLTLRQWQRGERPQVDPRVRVVSAGPRFALYTGDGRRRLLPPIVFGLGVLWHLLREGRRYDVVHTASFPYFSLLAAGAVRPFARFALIADWHEVWSEAYWREYLGRIGGSIGHAVQRRCARLPQRAFCFSRLHAGRLRDEGLHGEIVVLEGEYAGPLQRPSVRQAQLVVVSAGRLIPEKRVPQAVAGIAAATRHIEGLHGLVFGDGPERQAVLAAIDRYAPEASIEAPGFVAEDRLQESLASALCMLATSRREGYGLIVVEAASLGTPSIVVAGEDNAAVELIEHGVNGFVAPSAEPEALAEAIERVHEAGQALRERTADWFAANALRLSLSASLETVTAHYRALAPAASARS
jgi:glycosyltransferase involved in cell wall biosynthesis